MGLITARAGSKGLKNKNMMQLGGRNLIEIAISFAKQILPENKILLSTDYSFENFNNLLNKSQYLKRSKNLCSDETSIIDVCLNAYDYISSQTVNNITDIILIQPTSPLREIKDLKSALKIYKANKLKSLASVSPVIQSPYEIIEGIGNNWKPITSWYGHLNRQKIKSNYFYINGNFYIFNVNKLKSSRTIIDSETYMFSSTKKYFIDIDDSQDFDLIKKII